MTTTKEPASVAILAARVAKAFPTLSPYAAAHYATRIESLDRRWHRHCERCCCGSDGGYVKWEGGEWRHDPVAEERKDMSLRKAIKDALDALDATSPGLGGTDYELQGDPRGRVLLLRLPGELEVS